MIKSNDKIYLSSGICYFKGKKKNGLDKSIINYKIGGVERNKRKVSSYTCDGLTEFIEVATIQVEKTRRERRL